MKRTYTRVATYRVIRFFEGRYREPFVLRKGLTKEAAQAWCADPETSSSTCTTPARRRYTRDNGRWFDSWQAM